MADPGTILVTGAAGFIGSHVVERLLADGRTVVGLDNFDDFYDPAVKRRNLARVESRHGFALVEGDIRDGALLERVMSSHHIGSMIHLAARAGVRPSIANPVLYTSVNLDGTTRLLEAARHHGVRRFVFASSSSVYGNNDRVPFGEDDPVDHPISPYAATKKAGEVLCHAHHHLFGIAVACLRFFTVYGPRQRPEMAIHKFTALIEDGRPIEQYGAGDSARDYTYIDDIVDGVVRAHDRCSDYHIWNLGGSRTVTLAELVAKISATLGVEAEVRRLPPQPGDVERTFADIDRAGRDLDWRPTIDIDDGLRRFVAWYRSGRQQGRTP